MSEQQQETKTCPFCAEQIQVEAIKCKHCGSELTGRAKTRAGLRKQDIIAKIVGGIVGFAAVIWLLGWTWIWAAVLCSVLLILVMKWKRH